MSVNALLSLNNVSLDRLSKILSVGPKREIDNILLGAVLQGNEKAVQSALLSGADANVATIFGFRPLHLAAICYAERQASLRSCQEFDAICEHLIRAGADISARDTGIPKEHLYGGEGHTASARAASRGSSPPSLSRAMAAIAKHGMLDGRSGDLDGNGNWHETDPVIDGKRKYLRRAYRFNGHWGKGGKKAVNG